MESTADWTECRVALPPLRNWLVLDLATEDPEAWARALADEHLDSGARAEWREAFAGDLLWYWGAARRQGALCAALLAPADGAVMASYTVRELKVPPESLSVAAFRAEAAGAEGPFFGEQDLDEVDLPLGPALRVHRLEPTAPESDGGGVLEGVAHYVLPSHHPTALECRLLWSTLGFGEELEKVADELAESLRLT
ncbi:hypothetical protein ACFY1L_48420 [Streptomyces sp. NPDC001663]|uniref:hypothetical protein n=1 Tax=Streptomyces sp. NPDC001663 TaxID=3364597 RepID=UPI00367A1595